MVYEQMCELSDFECETYCLWKYYGDEDGASFGFASLNLLPIFGWDGWPLIDEQFGEPQKAGCKPGTYASVLVSNRRTCDKNVWIRCWSGDDKKKEWKILEKEGFGFQFKPVHNTLFVCEWVLDSTRQKIGFDVYGGKSDKTGKKNFYYAVKNDGVYFGTEKGKEDELKEKWDSPCEGNEDEEENNNNNDDTDVNSAEPTGESSVPAAACGKRIVGYYTGWSKREVDEEQLKKLTHVVFAFVAMRGDGSIAFDKKARKVNAGVHILFALGGWDNSQYFSTVAADSSRRTTFINNIIQFLKDEKIDGVDLDWEYPVTGGATEGVAADKENFVALLKELRGALDNLQKETNRKQPYLISYASAAGDWTMRPAYDLESIIKYVDFINIMTYDYYGAWGSKWGKYTGPPAPLFYGSPKGFSGKLNADFTTKYYSCNTKKPSKINMGVPFYGRFWKNVGAAIGDDEMWRVADEVGGKYEGGYVAWRDIGQSWNMGAAKIHEKVKSPYIWNSGSREYLGFENEESLKNIGGLMIWAIDQDDDANTLLNLVSSADLWNPGTLTEKTLTERTLTERTMTERTLADREF
uniref:GH18 domain-containing protein n=1 Tax=Panagrolaimus superbus TaxID=310955 RepID=A0A914ZBG4_9BILA